jgi:hypothetical protein
MIVLANRHTLFKPKLDNLPAELIAHIASFLENDHDVISLYLSKKKFLKSINKFAYLFKMKLPPDLNDGTLYFGEVNKLLLRAYLHPEKLGDHLAVKHENHASKHTLLFFIMIIVAYAFLLPKLLNDISPTNLSFFIINFGVMKSILDTHEAMESKIEITKSYANEGILANLNDDFISDLIAKKQQHLDHKVSDTPTKRVLQ